MAASLMARLTHSSSPSGHCRYPRGDGHTSPCLGHHMVSRSGELRCGVTTPQTPQRAAPSAQPVIRRTSAEMPARSSLGNCCNDGKINFSTLPSGMRGSPSPRTAARTHSRDSPSIAALASMSDVNGRERGASVSHNVWSSTPVLRSCDDTGFAHHSAKSASLRENVHSLPRQRSESTSKFKIGTVMPVNTSSSKLNSNNPVHGAAGRTAEEVQPRLGSCAPVATHLSPRTARPTLGYGHTGFRHPRPSDFSPLKQTSQETAENRAAEKPRLGSGGQQPHSPNRSMDFGNDRGDQGSAGSIRSTCAVSASTLTSSVGASPVPRSLSDSSSVVTCPYSYMDTVEALQDNQTCHVELTRSPWEWTVEEVQSFLGRIGLEEVKEVFRDHEVTGLVLLSMSEDDLKTSLGIWKFGTRRKLTLELHELRVWYRHASVNGGGGSPRDNAASAQRFEEKPTVVEIYSPTAEKLQSCSSRPRSRMHCPEARDAEILRDGGL